MKKFAYIILVSILIMSVFSSCSQDEKTGNVNFGEYVISDAETTSLNYDVSQVLNTDSSWQSSYALSYTYYDKKSGESVITEGKCGKYYQSLDKATDIATFITQEDGYMIQYMLNNNTAEGTATIVTNSTIDDLYSGFIQLSVCDPYFPVYKNVTKVGTDFVAGRSAVRYKQIEKENGADKKIAYVWIDDQYGFASRCELYDAETQELQMRWELLEFTRNVTEDAVKINVDAYDIAESGN